MEKCLLLFQCDPGVGMDALYDFIYNKPQLLMVIGSACSSVTQTVGQLISNWNLLQVSDLSNNTCGV
jgi:gamma-aminobutyric acid type B receptor